MTARTIAEDFFANLITSETNNHFSLTDYFTNLCSANVNLSPNLPDLLCYKHVSVSSPFSYSISNLNAFCMILTTKGAGQLEYNGQFYSLVSDSLVFLDCRLLHRLTCLRNIWEYTICFVSTPITEYYYAKSCSEHHCVFQLGPYTDFQSIWNRLLHETQDDELHAMLRAKTLTQLFTELYLIRKSEESETFHIPSYILDMKKNFDTACDEPFSLNKAAIRYHVNKYRLCREFSTHFHDTPLQYLNHVRIEKAKELLLHSDDKISVIGQKVGIENTNHFIRLFKEKTGVTPLKFRKETPIINSIH